MHHLTIELGYGPRDSTGQFTVWLGVKQRRVRRRARCVHQGAKVWEGEVRGPVGERN